MKIFNRYLPRSYDVHSNVEIGSDLSNDDGHLLRPPALRVRVTWHTQLIKHRRLRHKYQKTLTVVVQKEVVSNLLLLALGQQNPSVLCLVRSQEIHEDSGDRCVARTCNGKGSDSQWDAKVSLTQTYPCRIES